LGLTKCAPEGGVIYIHPGTNEVKDPLLKGEEGMGAQFRKKKDARWKGKAHEWTGRGGLKQFDNGYPKRHGTKGHRILTG